MYVIRIYMHMTLYMYLRKCADAERGLELSCACMALLMASTQPKRSTSSLAMKKYSAPLGSLRREGGREAEGEGREGGRVGGWEWEGEGREGGRVGGRRGGESGRGEWEGEWEREGEGRVGGESGRESGREKGRGEWEGRVGGRRPPPPLLLLTLLPICFLHFRLSAKERKFLLLSSQGLLKVFLKLKQFFHCVNRVLKTIEERRRRRQKRRRRGEGGGGGGGGGGGRGEGRGEERQGVRGEPCKRK